MKAKHFLNCHFYHNSETKLFISDLAKHMHALHIRLLYGLANFYCLLYGLA